MVPLGSHSAASLPRSAAIRSCSKLTVGSSPYWSSPTGAAAMAARIAAVGRVTVSERRSMEVVSIIVLQVWVVLRQSRHGGFTGSDQGTAYLDHLHKRSVLAKVRWRCGCSP